MFKSKKKKHPALFTGCKDVDLIILSYLDIPALRRFCCLNNYCCRLVHGDERYIEVQQFHVVYDVGFLRNQRKQSHYRNSKINRKIDHLEVTIPRKMKNW